MINRRILLVEDEINLHQIYKQILESSGYEVVCTSDGKEALKLLKDQTFNLLLLDIMIPEIDGIELLKQLNEIKHPLLIDGKILMMTVLDDDQMISEALSLGATGYLVKSEIDPGKLASVVNDFIL